MSIKRKIIRIISLAVGFALTLCACGTQGASPAQSQGAPDAPQSQQAEPAPDAPYTGPLYEFEYRPVRQDIPDYCYFTTIDRLVGDSAGGSAVDKVGLFYGYGFQAGRLQSYVRRDDSSRYEDCFCWEDGTPLTDLPFDGLFNLDACYGDIYLFTGHSRIRAQRLSGKGKAHDFVLVNGADNTILYDSQDGVLAGCLEHWPAEHTDFYTREGRFPILDNGTRAYIDLATGQEVTEAQDPEGVAAMFQCQPVISEDSANRSRAFPTLCWQTDGIRLEEDLYLRIAQPVRDYGLFEMEEINQYEFVDANGTVYPVQLPDGSPTGKITVYEDGRILVNGHYEDQYEQAYYILPHRIAPEGTAIPEEFLEQAPPEGRPDTHAILYNVFFFYLTVDEEMTLYADVTVEGHTSQLEFHLNPGVTYLQDMYSLFSPTSSVRFHYTDPETGEEREDFQEACPEIAEDVDNFVNGFAEHIYHLCTK